MNCNAIGAVGEIVGAVAVIPTLLYLAKRINQTNRISRLNSTSQLMARFDETNTLIVSDPDKRRVLLERDALSEEESEYLYAFGDISWNSYVAVEPAYQAQPVDQPAYATAARDLEISIRRWPNAMDSFELWLRRYPEMRSYGIFQCLC